MSDSINYTQRTFQHAVTKIRQLYYNGNTVNEIGKIVGLSEIIVEGIIERYVHAKQETR